MSIKVRVQTELWVMESEYGEQQQYAVTRGGTDERIYHALRVVREALEANVYWNTVTVTIVREGADVRRIRSNIVPRFELKGSAPNSGHGAADGFGGSDFP